MLRGALGVNGAAMFLWSFALFFRHRSIIATVEGRRVAAGRRGDVMPCIYAGV